MPKNVNEKLKQQNNSNTPKYMPKRSVCRKINPFCLKTVLAFATVLVLLFIFLFTNKKIDGIFVKNNLNFFTDFVFTPANKIKSTDQRINILILGKSGEGYFAPDLTDTVIFTSVSLIEPSVRIISIPRDIWIPEIRAKLNSAYYWGKQKDNDGLSLAASQVEGIFEKPIHYVVVFDFSSFTKIIDVLGGVKVDVENSFIDEKYPIAGKENDLCNGDMTFQCRYETIKFEKGLQQMNGQTALKYVRSRNAQGDEGTDIAREKRQQKIIIAVKNTILSSKTLLNPKKIWEIWLVLKRTIETNIDESAGVIIARKLLDAKNNIRSSVIPEELLFNPPISLRYDNQYVFVFKSGNFIEVRKWIESFLD